ncbi:MAG: cysteine--tRNA ligase [Clostridia bacterium]|nr:cysteine--tRNA ligase [Clostridia bacterium]
MRIYNTLTRTKEEFVPLEPGKVKMYACGITVSGEAHIGHGFQALIYDIMRKYLIKKGYEVTYARNYTDIDDKIIAASALAGIPAGEYAEMMIKDIDRVMRAFDVDDPDIWLKATENIDNIIDFIQGLIDSGHAYPTPGGDVYFDESSFADYGKLSHNTNAEEMFESVRIQNDEEKRNPQDFALWKSAKEGEPWWPSPWGDGRPGWHIECSAMNRAAFGEQIDIHGGGRDLIFPHHENEIAQTEALTGKEFVKYWTHNGLIKVNGQKMSKSLGNSLLLDDLLKKYTNEAIKLALLSGNYRSDVNITDELFPEAEKHLTEFYRTLDAVETAYGKIEGENKEIDARFDECMDDDFNAALALSDLFSVFRNINRKLQAGDKSCVADAAQVIKTYSLLGIFRKSPGDYLAEVKDKSGDEGDIPEEIKKLAEKRWQAKLSRDWGTADAIRAELDAKGYAVKDGKTDYEITKK